MPDITPNTLSRRRIAGNATFLVTRTVLSTLIGLFTSRVVLQVLGVDDFGINALAGVVTGFMGYFTSSLAGAGSRFIAYEIGRGDAAGVRRMFAAVLFIHIALAVAIIVAGETIGLWFLESRLNIPPERLHAARWVYHLSIISAAAGITQTPYSAIIMSHERMRAYAAFDIAGMVLRLLIVYLLTVIGGDKLIVYATLGFAVSVVMLLANRLYCMRMFAECRLRPRYDGGATRRIFSYSAFTGCSTICVGLCLSGTTFLINMFFGVAANTAVALAATVHGITMLFAANIQAAFRPQIMKQYAAGNASNVWMLACMSGKFTILIMAPFVVPAIIEAPVILQLWLGQVPPMSVAFLRCMLAVGWMGCLCNQFDTVVYSTERIGRQTVWKCACFLLNLAAIYLLFACGSAAWSAYLANGVMYVVLISGNMVIACRLLDGIRPLEFAGNVARGLAVSALGLAVPAVVCSLMEQSTARLFVVCALYSAAVLPLAWRFVLSVEERRGIAALARDKFGRVISITRNADESA